MNKIFKKVQLYLQVFERGWLMVLLFCCISIEATAKNYYFSNSTGNDSYSSTQAQNIATPWKSINKLNSFFNSLAPGDSVLFKRGESFYGAITVSKSGAFNNHIVFGAYGTGLNPIITGFSTITNWVLLSNGIYQAAVATANGNLNMLTLNNQPMQIGRYPNRDDINGGYLKYESFVDTTSITDIELTSSTNWTGAEVVIRKKLWVLDRCKIINHSGTTITYINPISSNYTSNNNYGYFIQNDPRTLDQLGEWYFEPVNKNLQIFFGAALPANYTIRAGTIDTLVNINLMKYISFKNISFEGANQFAFYSINADFITIQNCDISNIGGTGFYAQAVSDILIDNVNTTNILSNAIRIASSLDSNVVIRNCSIVKTGAIRGMGLSGGNSYKGIMAEISNNLLIENNKIDTTGYVGIEFEGSNVLVKNNVVNYFCYNKDDAGGIYSWGAGTDSTLTGNFSNRVIRDNIVMNGIGASEGRSSTNPFVSGIYLDGRTNNIDVINNTVFNNQKNGIHCNNPNNVNIKGNTSFNNLNALSFMRWPWGSINNLTVSNNIFYPKLNTQRNIYYTNAALNEPEPTTLQATMQALGSFDSNYHSCSNEVGFNYEIYPTTGAALLPSSPQSFPGWKVFTGIDSDSKAPFREAPKYLLRSLTGLNKFTNGTFTSSISGITIFAANTSISWDNTGKILGGALKVDFSAPVANKYSLMHSPVGAISNTKNYILRFTTLGTNPNGIIRVYLRKTASPYTGLTAVQVKCFDNTIKNHEILFAAPVSDLGTSLVFEIEQNSGTTYLDNISFTEADATAFAIDDFLRLEYNASSTSKTIALGANYLGVDGTYYSGSITLQPFTSKILVKDTSIIRQALAVQTNADAISCFGGATKVTVTATGGIPPYTGTGLYSVTAGTYTYTVTDLSGVTASSTITVSQPVAALNVTAVAAPIAVYGGATNVIVSATGGTSPYTGTGTILNVYAGTYTYTVTDSKGCAASYTLTLTQPIAFLTVNNTAPAIACNGGTASINISASGGTMPYTGTGNFNVSTGRGSLKLVFPTIVTGTYTGLYFTIGAVSSAKNYVLRFSTLGTTVSGNLRVAIRQTNTPWATLTAKQTASFGTGRVDHEFTFNAPTTDAAASFLIEINQNSGTTYIDNIAFFEKGLYNNLVGNNLYTNSNFEAGINNLIILSSNNNHIATWDTTGKINSTYYFTAKDVNNVTGTTIVNVSQPDVLQTTASAGSINVFGGSTAVQIAAVGGTVPYTGTGSITNVLAGTYSYFITDSKGCTVSTSITITQPPLLVVTTSATPINCFGSTSSVSVTASGGIPPYTGTGTYNLVAGTYNFAVIDSGGAVKNVTVAITQPAAALQVNAVPGTIAVFGGTTSVTVTATGGTSPYTGAGIINNVLAGTYTYLVTDANGCTASKTILITQPAILKAIVSASSINCFGGTTPVTVTATGGVQPYTGTGEFNVAAGTYTYTVKDASNVVNSVSITVTQPAAALQAIATAGIISIAGGTTTITVTATGGTSPYIGTGTISNVSAGTYIYTVTDSKGCSANTSVTINPPAATLAAAASAAAIPCFGGSVNVNVTATGGTTPYTGTGVYPVTTGKGSLKLSFPAVVTGTYTAFYFTIGSIISSKNYVLRFSTLGTTGSGNLKASIRQTNTPWTTITAKQNAVYANNKVDHEFVFIAPPNETAASFMIEFNQNSGTTYLDNIAFFELGASNNLVGNNLYSSGSFETGISNLFVYSVNNNQTIEWDTTGKISANYYFTVRDANNNLSTAYVNSSQPNLLQASATAGTIAVFGGTTSVVIAATGGTAPYTGTGTINNVTAGTYNYIITDVNGCTTTASVIITQPAAPLAASNAAVSINCFGSSTLFTLTSTTGVAPFTGTGTYNINAGKGSLRYSFPAVVNGTYSSMYSTIGPVSSLKNYVLKFTTLGTTSTGTLRVAVRQTNSPWANITAKQSATFGSSRKDHEFIFVAPTTQTAASFMIELNQNSGTTYIDNLAFFESDINGKLIGNNLYAAGNFESGITGMFFYSDNGNQTTTWDTTSKIASTYYYVITDATGASVTSVVNTSQPLAPLQTSVTAGNIVTTGGTTFVTVIATGGTAPYTGTGTFGPVPVGTYSYTVTDSKGCSSTKTITIVQTATRPANAEPVTTSAIFKPLSISAYPNPTNSKFGLLIKGGNNGKLAVSVSTIDGRIVYATIGKPAQQYSFGEDLPTGVYIAKVLQGKDLQTIKLVKIK